MGEIERGEPLNLCGAELEKLLLSENQTPYLLCLFAPIIFLEKKKGTYNQEVATRTGARLSEQTWYSFNIIYADFFFL